MWEFLGGVSESAGGGAAGVLATLLVLILVGIGIGSRFAWTFVRGQIVELATLRVELEALGKTHEAEMDALRAAESSKRAEMRASFENERGDREERHAGRMEAVNEARIADFSELLERVVTHVETTKAGLDKLLKTLEVLISLTRS
jgi:biopolymer transport protein ExbB/TolQ